MRKLSEDHRERTIRTCTSSNNDNNHATKHLNVTNRADNNDNDEHWSGSHACIYSSSRKGHKDSRVQNLLKCKMRRIEKTWNSSVNGRPNNTSIQNEMCAITSMVMCMALCPQVVISSYVLLLLPPHFFSNDGQSNSMCASAVEREPQKGFASLLFCFVELLRWFWFWLLGRFEGWRRRIHANVYVMLSEYAFLMRMFRVETSFIL